MNSTDTVTLEVSGRDVQFLLALQLSYTAYINWLSDLVSDHALQANDRALDAVYTHYYTPDEANALLQRIKAVLPTSTPIILATPDSGTSYVH